MQKWIQPPACSVHGLHIQNPVFLLAGALILDEKTPQSPALFWFGLRNDEFLHSQAATQRTIDVFRAFMEYGLAKKIAAWEPASREPNKQED